MTTKIVPTTTNYGWRGEVWVGWGGERSVRDLAECLTYLDQTKGPRAIKREPPTGCSVASRGRR